MRTGEGSIAPAVGRQRTRRESKSHKRKRLWQFNFLNCDRLQNQFFLQNFRLQVSLHLLQFLHFFGCSPKRTVFTYTRIRLHNTPNRSFFFPSISFSTKFHWRLWSTKRDVQPFTGYFYSPNTMFSPNIQTGSPNFPNPTGPSDDITMSGRSCSGELPSRTKTNRWIKKNDCDFKQTPTRLPRYVPPRKRKEDDSDNLELDADEQTDGDTPIPNPG